MIPHLKTERLVLRAFRDEDIEEYAAIMADPEVTKYLRGVTLSRDDSWREMAMFLGHWALRGYGFWAIERKEDGVLLGRAGLWNPEGWPGLEVGWTLGRTHWGNGYATEAARAALDYAFITQPVERMISVIHVDNIASQKVAERIGETRGEQREVRGAPCYIYQIPRTRWSRLAEKGARADG